ncbi:uncharacterized protein J4E78_003036 [Alternaria triticimaculans]|uniref:uncharacterized protein n=1 Tax=Alternaria triticimaculans TaxID=297637 RepID=UPI0020C406B0|nr:uncharacterized protein J4E78_003036 [Alternaria triticimaculans]KAI4665574.1 hypothetical protein J4E78_003036 [Alternaria triticimaculans]
MRTAVNVTSTMCERPVRDRSNVIFLTGITAGSVALAAVTIRTWSAISQDSFGLDDVFAIAAEAACLPVTVIQCYTPKLGFGKDTWVVPHSDIYKVLRVNKRCSMRGCLLTAQQLTYGSQISYFLCCGLTKLAFLFFFLRIFPSETTRKWIWVFIVISVLWTIAFAFTMTFACRPISAVWTSWDGTSTPDYCINQNLFYLVAAAFNIGLDVAIVLIPIPNLMTLKLSSRKKVFLSAIFGVGGITIIVSCIRLSAVAKYATSQNPMYDNLMSGVYSILEINVGIICVSMPAFRRFLAQLVPKCFGTTQNNSDPNEDDDTPNRPSKRRGKPSRSMLDASLFNTTMARTVDDTLEGIGKADDEVHLVELRRSGSKTSTQNMDGSMRGHDEEKMPPSYHAS